MKRLLALVLLTLCATAEATEKPAPSMYPEIIGKDYATARALLRKRGARPDDLRARKFRNCLFPSACQFPEYYTCFGDQPACVFIWRAADGGFLDVQTSNLPDEPIPDLFPVTYIRRSKTDK